MVRNLRAEDCSLERRFFLRQAGSMLACTGSRTGDINRGMLQLPFRIKLPFRIIRVSLEMFERAGCPNGHHRARTELLNEPLVVC